MHDDEVPKAQTRQRRLTSWEKYSYWELFFLPELQREFDEMLASRPVWPSRIFIVVATLFLLCAPIVAYLLE